MATPIVFSKTQYLAGYAGGGTLISSVTTGIFYAFGLNKSALTLNGVVNQPGDSVEVSGISPNGTSY